jgi:hypothetical protein
MRNLVLALVTAGVVLGFGACDSASIGDDAVTVARGKYLVTLAGCTDCHTPWKAGPRGPEPDAERYLSGHPQDAGLPPPPELPPGPWNVVTGGMTAWAGPWGISYGTNLTSDADTGLGAWSEQMFVEALRTGQHLGMGRDILPPMPWAAYANCTDEDLGAMFAFLMTVPAIPNEVPDPVPPPVTGDSETG